MLTFDFSVIAKTLALALLALTAIPPVAAVHELGIDPTSPFSCPDDSWLSFPLARKCYKSFKEEPSWFDCQIKKCGPLGGTIATVDTENTNLILRTFGEKVGE